MSQNKIIVGGGIAGLFSALLLNKQGYNVTVIEKAPEVGGLLRSMQLFKDDMFFDYGTHLPQETGISEIDDLLFENLNAHEIKNVSCGTYKSSLYEKNGFITDLDLDEDKRKVFLNELLATKPKPEYDNLEDQLIHHFGKGYYDSLIKDSIQKFFYTNAKDLVPNAHKLFGLSRIIVANEETTRELKKDPDIDAVIAYHSYKEGASNRKTLYPKTGGAGNWIKSLLTTLEDNGVKILTNCSIEKLVIEDNKITRVDTDLGNFDTDELIWTIPPFLLLQLLNIKPEKSGPPKLLSSAIFNFVVDKNYLTDVFYLQCQNKDLISFRVTLYNNFSPRDDGYYLITSEVLLDSPRSDLEEIETRVFDELIEMRVIAADATKVFSQHHIITNGFPVPTEAFIASSAGQNQLAYESCNNIRIFGKGGGDKWFMNEVIVDIHGSLGEDQ